MHQINAISQQINELTIKIHCLSRKFVNNIPAILIGVWFTDMAVTDDIDIYRAAKLYIDQHGDQAAIQAATRADAFLEADDGNGCAMWRKINKAIELLQASQSDGLTH